MVYFFTPGDTSFKDRPETIVLPSDMTQRMIMMGRMILRALVGALARMSDTIPIKRASENANGNTTVHTIFRNRSHMAILDWIAE